MRRTGGARSVALLPDSKKDDYNLSVCSVLVLALAKCRCGYTVVVAKVAMLISCWQDYK